MREKTIDWVQWGEIPSKLFHWLLSRFPRKLCHTWEVLYYKKLHSDWICIHTLLYRLIREILNFVIEFKPLGLECAQLRGLRALSAVASISWWLAVTDYWAKSEVLSIWTVSDLVESIYTLNEAIFRYHGYFQTLLCTCIWWLCWLTRIVTRTVSGPHFFHLIESLISIDLNLKKTCGPI